jgi:biotin carboxylase
MFKANSRTPQGFLAQGREDAVVIVDPLTTGARLALEMQKRGYKLIRLLSQEFPERTLACIPDICKDLRWEETISYQGADETAEELQSLGKDYHIIACQIGCEAGVEVFDAVTEKVPGFPSNGSSLSAARRDKYLMGEQVRKAGLRAVKQQECLAWKGDAADFIASLGVVNSSSGSWCVLKPTKSAGTDGVFIAKTIGEAQDCFDRILGAANIFGEANQTVLVQEFLKGTEYIVDSVSLEGQHKCVAIWEYDKRRCNGAQFVYFGVRLYQSDDGKREAKMVDYVHKVIDALGIRHGPTHAEVMWLDGEDAPCLVEVGARPHGGEGTFIELVEPIIGYSQVSVMVDIVDKQYRFHRLPSRPARFSGLSMEVCLVAREEGKLAGYPLIEEVQQLQSFNSMEIKIPVGSRLEPTVDFLTTPGSINLVHEDPGVVEADRRWIEQMQEEGKFYALVDPLLEKARCGGAGREGWMCSPSAQLARQISPTLASPASPPAHFSKSSRAGAGNGGG